MCGKLTGRTGDVTRIFPPLGLFMAFRQMWKIKKKLGTTLKKFSNLHIQCSLLYQQLKCFSPRVPWSSVPILLYQSGLGKQPPHRRGDVTWGISYMCSGWGNPELSNTRKLLPLLELEECRKEVVFTRGSPVWGRTQEPGCQWEWGPQCERLFCWCWHSTGSATITKAGEAGGGTGGYQFPSPASWP